MVRRGLPVAVFLLAVAGAVAAALAAVAGGTDLVDFSTYVRAAGRLAAGGTPWPDAD